MTRPASGEEMAETAAASPSESTAAGHGRSAIASTMTPRELGAGDVLERYEIVGILGAGGMGRVYRARDPDLNRDLAIKVLRRTEGSQGSGGLERRLLREAQAMAKLNHPNLATVYDVGTVDGEVFLAFEFIDGQTLGAWARAGRTIAERLAALVAAGRGLEAAHGAGVIHRDFKPDNVLVGRDGSVKVVDFGLARGVGETRVEPTAPRGDELAVDLTVTGSILGTPAYMAPEQHHGVVADARADQFGFAVAAWEILYGERPFRGTTVTALAAAICAGEIMAPPAKTGVTPAVERVLRRALAVEPDKRFPDMGALLAALVPPAKVAAPRSVWRDPRTALVAFGMTTLALIAVYVGYVTNRKAPPRPSAIGDEAMAPDEARRFRERSAECYDIAQAETPAIGAGQVTIRVEIAETGRVMSAGILADDFKGEHGIATCLARQALALSFTPPPSGGRLTSSLSIPFEPRTFDIARDGDAFTLSAATWELLRTPGFLDRAVKVVPTEKDAKQIGYKLYAIRRGSVHERLGLENGDTITHVNGRPLDSTVASTKARMDLLDATSIAIQLNRKGQPRTLTYVVSRTP